MRPSTGGWVIRPSYLICLSFLIRLSFLSSYFSSGRRSHGMASCCLIRYPYLLYLLCPHPSLRFFRRLFSEGPCFSTAGQRQN